MPKPRTCPHCKITLPVETGFSFDKDLNLVCDHCGEIVVRVKQTEKEQKPISVPNTTSMLKKWEGGAE